MNQNNKMPPLEPKVKEAALHRQAMEAKETLRRLTEELPDHPKGMDYFYELYDNKYINGIKSQSDKPKIGTLCVQVPEEMIFAVGAEPERLCNGSFAFDQLGGEFMPARSCSLVKASLGRLSMDAGASEHEMLVLPTTCDQKKKAGALLEAMGHDAYMLEMPPFKDTEEGREYWLQAVERFGESLEKKTGKKIKKKGMKEALHLTNEARREFRRFFALRRDEAALIHGSDAFLVTNSYFFDEIQSWTKALKALNDELEGRKAEGFSLVNARAPRILYTGSPAIFPNLKIPLLIEETGAIVATDEACSSNRLLYDSPIAGEGSLSDMIASIADRYLKPVTCPCYVPNEDRQRKLKRMIEEYRIDGVIYQALSGCQLYEMERKPTEWNMEDLGIPMLYLESDYSPEDKGQLSTRIEAFLESIQQKKRRRK